MRRTALLHKLSSVVSSASSNGANVKPPFFQLLEITNFAEVTSRHEFERQIFSRLGQVGVKRLSRFNYIPPPFNQKETFTDRFVKQHEAVLERPKKQDRIPNYERLDGVTSFEADLFIQCPVDEEGPSLGSVLKGVIEHVVCTKGFTWNKIPMGGKWLLGEITESPALIPHKLTQLERALHFLPRIGLNIDDTSIGALAVLVNGSRDEFDQVVQNYMVLPPTLKLSQHPVVFGWTPYRNIYSELVTVKQDIHNLNTKLDTILQILLENFPKNKQVARLAGEKENDSQ